MRPRRDKRRFDLISQCPAVRSPVVWRAKRNRQRKMFARREDWLGRMSGRLAIVEVGRVRFRPA